MQQGCSAGQGTWDRMQDVLPRPTLCILATADEGKCSSQWAKLAPSQGSNSTAVTSIPKMSPSIGTAH